jgi:hypothetical protein
MTADEQNENETAAATVEKAKRAARKRRSKRGTSRTLRATARGQTTQARSFAHKYGRKTSGLVRQGKRLLDDAYGWVDDARGAVPRIAANMHLPSARRIESFAAANPVLLSAVGLGIGVIIGALLPRDAFHTGLQEFGLAGASPPASPRSRKTPRTRTRKK